MTSRTGSPAVMLITATAGFALNFWAWALLSPLGPLWRDQGNLGPISESDVALLVAIPVIVGSLGRIIIGAMTDRFGGRLMFPLVSVVTVVPILYIGVFAQTSLGAALIGGFFLGIAGTAFAIGVPFVNAWYPPQRRGLATGVFGAGMGGTAISALTTVWLYTNLGSRAPFIITAVVLIVYAVISWLVLREAPSWQPATIPLMQRIRSNAFLPLTWQASILYAVAFGGYVAFSVYLPAYLKTGYDLSPGDAAMRMAGFVVVAVILRPVGGWLSDKYGAIAVLATSFVIVAAGAALASTGLPVHTFGAVAFLSMAAALGAGSGAVFALIAQAAEPSRVGGITGLVGAAGGLGGFVPPLLMGYIYGRTDSYMFGLLLLTIVAIGTLILTLTVVRATAVSARQHPGN